MTYLFEKHHTTPRYSITPREYQHEALDSCFRLWDQGKAGALIRIFTGGGKTITTCMLADRWLQRGDDYRVMVISYEKQLVWQFAQEIEDVLRISPGIEMEREEIDPFSIPKIVVASRQTLAIHQPISVEQREFLNQHGFDDEQLGLCTKLLAKKLIRPIRRGVPLDVARPIIEEQLDEFHRDYRCDRDSQRVSRLHKFDWRDNWLICFDEAHKHVTKLTTVGHLVQWFERNPHSRRLGMTATPKRSDGVSLERMFPGIAIDYPLATFKGPCAVRDGYAVPYVQKYVKVESIDFEDIKALAGTNQKKWDAEIAERLETELATYCEPTLDLVGDRRTLIFSPSVDMAKSVADYINARAKCRCQCGMTQWHVRSRVGDGAKCNQCDRMLTEDDLLETPELQAQALWGEVPPNARKTVYEGHQHGKFQFLSVCGLAREGYNDPDISCIAIFRPVSKAASSLAEQMKGRGSRPLRGLIEGLQTAEERLEAISTSSKPDCLVIDLTGITGLGDCATTVQIYAEGEEDEVVERAEELVHGGMEDVSGAIEQAKEEVAQQRERQRKEREKREAAAREQARRRAEARAKATYTTHDVGHGDQTNRNMATTAQLRYLRFLGMEITGWEPSRRQAGRMITQLKEGTSPEQVAYRNGIEENQWEQARMTSKQHRKLVSLGHWNPDPLMSPWQASQLIDKLIHGGRDPAEAVITSINRAANQQELDLLSRSIRPHWHSYSETERAQIRQAGLARREIVDQESF